MSDANLLNWTLGHEGKGNVYADGHISTWDIDDVQEPHHQEVADQEEEFQPVFLFYITPEGGIHDGGIGFNNLTSKPDATVLAEITQADHNLWDASSEEVEQNDDTTPRDPDSFAHADKLMYSKLASMGAMHCELEIPRHIRREIRKWVDRLEWPEGSEIHDARKYHITILTFDKYCPDFIKFMSNEIKGREFTFKSSRMDMFGDYLVLRLECPEWEELAVRWGELADDRGLEPRRFPGGPKCHVSVGEIPGGKWPQGVPNPNIEFTTKMFNVNINSKTAAVDPSFIQNIHQHTAFQFNDPKPSVLAPAGTCGTCGSENTQAIHYYAEPAYVCNICRAKTFPERKVAPEVMGPVTSAADSIEDELAKWLQTVDTTPPQPISPHHSDPTQVVPNEPLPRARGPHIDPPSEPYEPYDWANQGDFVSHISGTNGDSALHMEHYADATDAPDDQPGDTLMPPDWVHLQGRTQHFYDQALEDYKTFQQGSQLGHGQPQEHALIMAQDRLIENLESLGLNDQDIYDVAKRFNNECMDSIPQNPTYPSTYTEPAVEDKPSPDSQWMNADPQGFVDNALNPDAPDPEGFFSPPGWETSPQETQALIYQKMRDSINEIRNGQPVNSVYLRFFAELDRMSLSPERKEQAAAEFKQFATQVAQESVNQRAVQQEHNYNPLPGVDINTQGVPDTIPPEWTAAMKRVASIVIADMWHCDDPECQKEHAEGDGDAARCSECGHWALHIPCDHCGADPANQHNDMKEEWSDRIYGQPGSPTEWPKQKTIWRDESAQDIKWASQQWDL